jgi:Signal transduction histidine kinase
MESRNTLRQKIVRAIPLLAGIYAVAAGAISLLGWVTGFMRLADWNNSGITMKANAAFCSMLAGSALLNSVLVPRRKLLIAALSALVAIIGGLTLLQHLTSINLGIDTLIFTESPGVLATAAPGRMGPPASTAFILIGVALLLSTGSRSSRRLAGWLGLWVVILSALPLVGYWYGASELYSFARLTGIALQTAVIIAALAVGVVLSIPEWGIVTMIKSNDGGGIMFRRLLLPLIAISLMLGWMRVAGEHAGLYDTAFGTAIRTIFELTLLTGLLWWTANGISRAEEKVRDADRRKDEFLAVLSHELRNPLAPIRNAVDILKTAGSDEPRPQAARDMIERQVDHLVRLIDDLLDVNRITRNKIDLQSETLDMGSVVRRSTESCRSIIDKKHQFLHLDLPNEPVFVRGDQIRLSQIFTNLLNNAGKFTGPGGNIWVTVHRSNENALISVRDDGIGIPSDKLDSIFKMFSQLDRPAGEPRDGLGIGLTLTKQLVELHGGTILANSSYGQPGSEFAVRLPLCETAEVPVTELIPTLNAPHEGKRSILVVDDNIDSAESLSLLMQFAGHETQISHDGRDAVKKARSMRPDVILLDIGLPLADGYEVCRTVRQEPWGKDIIIIALTGWGQDEDRRRSNEAGFDAHMVKPVDPADLIDLISEIQKQNGPALKLSAKR